MKKKYKIIIGVVLVLWLLATFTNSKDTELADNEPSTQTEIETQTESEAETEVVEMEPEIDVDELTEEEYKAQCQEIYDDDTTTLEEKMKVGQLVKVEGYLSNKYKDLQVAVFGEWRNRLQTRYFKCGVINKDRSDSILVYGERVYLVFDKDGEWVADDFEVEQDVIVYGEVIHKWDDVGVYIMPKYMEVVER